MPVNRNALIRYRTLDHCLRNRYRKWTLEDLMEACSAALYEYEGIDKGVSRRTVQMDLQLMRSDKLGYNAPIQVIDKKYYRYQDPDYSITNNPLTDQDLHRLTEVVDILKQFKGFRHFRDLSEMVQRLEDKIYTSQTRQPTCIDFEKNDHLKGLEHLDTLYRAVQQQRALALSYQSFGAREANQFVFHPYYLKQYRNRWFVLGGKEQQTPLLTLALDRIVGIGDTDEPFTPCANPDLPGFFQHVIGVTVQANQGPEEVLLFFHQRAAPYVLTKPLHPSQRVVEQPSSGIVVSLRVQHNYELEREILGFGDSVKVLAPERLRRRIKEVLADALDLYRYEINHTNLAHQLQKLVHKGFSILPHVFTKKETNHLKSLIVRYQNPEGSGEKEPVYAIRNLLQAIPGLKNGLFNPHLKAILAAIDPGLFLSKALYFDKPPQSNWSVAWHQDTTISVKERIETEGFFGWTHKEGVVGVCPPEDIRKQTLTLRIHLDDADEQNGALKVIPGSHHQRLGHEEIALITQHSLPCVCEVGCGGVHLMKPLLLHASAKTVNQKHRRVIHQEFNSLDLPNGLAWAEKMTF
ncbi:MAG: WYL domain-containing protein [Ferruginibacter sp.]|nr:WYL domain-containing protein [Cytophagales bacterium]